MVVRANHKNYTSDVIKNFYLREKNTRLKIRLLAIKLSYEGRSVQDISEILSMTRQSVANWITDFDDYGIDGIKDSDNVGRPKLITESIEESAKKNR